MKAIKFNKVSFITLIMLMLSCILCLNFGLVANAQEVQPETNSFKMYEGAMVRLNKEGVNGIRFLGGMPRADYESLIAKVNDGTYDSIEFGVVIAPSSYEETFGELNEANLFSENAVYNWAVYKDNKWEYTPEEGKTRIIRICANRMQEGKNDDMVVYGGISDLKDENIQAEFTGQAYYVLTKGATKTYVFAEKDSAKKQAGAYNRTMEKVAKLAILDVTENALTTDQKQALQTMYIEKANPEKSEEKIDVILPGSVFVGDTITLTGKTNLNKAVKHTATFTPDYKGGVAVENITDEKYIAKDSGTLKVTYSLLGLKTITKQVKIDYPVEENEVFNPEIPKMIDNVAVDGPGIRMDISLKAGDATDKIYKGGYLSLKPLVEGKDGWVRLDKINPRQDRSAYDKFNSFSMWLRFTSTSDKVEIHFFNNENRILPANKWVKVYLNKDMFLNRKNNLIPWKNDSNWANGKAITEVRVGKIMGEDKVVLNNTIFAVSDDGTYSSGNFAVHEPGKRMGISLNAGDATDEIYKGGYLSLKPLIKKNDAIKESGWVRMERVFQYQYEHNENKEPYKGYNSASMWLRFTSTSQYVQIALFNSEVRTLPANKWVKVNFDLTKLLKCTGSMIPWVNDENWDKGKAITEVRVGAITAEKAPVPEEANLMFRVADDLSYVYGSYAAAGASNIQTTIHKGDANAIYKGSYVKFTPTNTAGKWGRIQRITAGTKLDNYTQKNIKVWIYVEGSGSHDISFFNNAACKQKLTTNKWLSITLDMQKYKENLKAGDNFMPFWSNTNNIKAIRIGDMIAE